MRTLLLFLFCSTLALGTTCSTNNCVQYDANNDGTGTTHSTFTATFGSNVTAGDTLVFMNGYSSTNASPTVADTLGNSWTCLAQVTATGPVWIQTCYTVSIASGGADTVTATYGFAVPFNFAVAEELSGIASFDVLVTGSGSYTTTATSSAFTTTAANDIAVVGAYFGSTVTGAGSGYTIRGNGTTNGWATEDGTLASSGSNTASFGMTGTANGAISGAAFKVSAATPSRGAALLLSQ